MNFQDKINLIKEDWAYIFSLKKGKLIEKGNICYQVNKLFSWIFYLYYYSGLVFFVLFFIFLLQPHYFDSLMMQSIETLIVYSIIETIIFFILPIKKIVCKEKHTVGL